MLRQERARVRADPGLSSLLVDPHTGNIRQEGDLLTWPSLGRTLRRLAAGGAAEFYHGQTARRLVEDVRAAGGRLTMRDLRNYRVQWREPVTYQLK